MRIFFASLVLVFSGVAGAATYDCSVVDVATEKVVGKMLVDSASDNPQIVTVDKNHAAVCSGADVAEGLRFLVCGYVAASADSLSALTGHQILSGKLSGVISLAATHEEAGILMSQSEIPALAQAYNTVCIAN